MNKKVILSVGLPFIIRNSEGRMATIELNEGEFVICRYHANDSYYLSDVKLEGWYPVGIFKYVLYRIKILLIKRLNEHK